VFIGTGKETLRRVNLELIRGSSVQADQRINRESVAERAIIAQTGETTFVLGAFDGVTNRIQVLNFPITNGSGQGLPSNNVADVVVTVNGIPVRPAGMRGALGVITLQIPPLPGDDVRVTYSFKRTDTLITDDLSAQVTTQPARLFGALPEPYTIVSGVNDTLILIVDGVTHTRTLPAVTGITASDLAVQINGLLIPGLTVFADTDNRGQGRLVFEAAQGILIGAGTANGVLGFITGQRTRRNQVFFTNQGPIVDGRNGGITTTDPTDVSVRVDNVPVIPLAVDGTNYSVTLPFAPAPGARVEITYFFNAWQDTFDYLPDTGVTNVLQVGNIPDKRDYREELDYVVLNDRILWGAATNIMSGVNTGGTDPFGSEQISTLLIDNRMYLERATRFVDRSVSPARESNTTFILENIPTLGNGRDTPLNLDVFHAVANDRIQVPSNRTDLIQVFTGPNLSSALLEGPRSVVRVTATNRRVTLAEPIPPDHFIWVSYYYNRLRDDRYTLEVQTQTSGLIPGQYTVTSRLQGQRLYDVRFGTTTSSVPIAWPSGVETDPDGFIVGGQGRNETVTVTFTQIPATPAILTNTSTGPYDLYATLSDRLYINVSGTPTTTNLNQPAPGTLVSGAHPSATLFTFTPSNNVFSFELDGVVFNANIPAGVYTGPQIVERMNRAALPLSTVTAGIAQPYDIISQVQGTNAAPFDIFSQITGSQVGPFNIFAAVQGTNAGPFDIFAEILGTNVGPFDTFATLTTPSSEPFDTTLGNHVFDLTVNGVPVSVNLTVGAAETAATLIADITAELTLQGLNVGPLTFPTTNDVEVLNQAGAIEIRATDSVVIGAGTANTPFGFVGGETSNAVVNFDVEINGTGVNAILQGAAAVPTSAVITALSAAATAAAFNVGPLNVLTNDVVFENIAGAVRIRSTNTVEIGLQTITNTLLGFADADLDRADNALEFNIDVNAAPIAVPVTLRGGIAIPTSRIAEDVNDAIALAGLTQGPLTTLTNQAHALVGPGQTLRIEVKESITVLAETANGALGLVPATITAPNVFDFTVNTIPVTASLLGNAAGRHVPAANIATALNAAAALAGVTVGVLTVPGNDFDAAVLAASILQLQATQNITIGAGTANPVLGFTNLATASSPNTFDLEVNGTPVTVLFNGGRGIAASQIQTEIEAALISSLIVVGDVSVSGNEADVSVQNGRVRIRARDSVEVLAGNANPVLGFADNTAVTTSDQLTFIMNGVPVNVTLNRLANQSALSIAAQINAQAVVAGLNVGPITTPGFEAQAVSVNGRLQVQAYQDLEVVAASANGIFGLVPSVLPSNVEFAKYRSGLNTDRFLIRSRVLPTNPSQVSRIRILSGTANATLLFTPFADATGTERAVNKPATVIGTNVTPLQIQNLALQNPVLRVRLQGSEFQVTGFTLVTNLADVANVINTVIAGAGSVTVEGQRLRVTSAVDTPDSLVEIVPAPANSFLGFTGTERGVLRRVAASEVAAVLNWQSLDWLAPSATDFNGQAFADVLGVQGQGSFLRMTTFEEGALRSLLIATGVQDATNDTVIGLQPGDNASGTDPIDGFHVTSNIPNGSSGHGTVGRTYTDAVTGLRFTVLAPTGGAYVVGESFTLVVSDTFLTGARPTQAMPGLETIVTTTAGVGVLDTGILDSYDGGGFEPRVNDFYYMSYDYVKPDFDIRLFTSLADVIAEYGDLDVDNALTVAAFLAFQNGASVIACKQVVRQPGLDQASSTAYIQAIQDLEKPLAGGINADVIVPLTFDLNVFNAAVRSAEVQSSIRYRQERSCIFGVASGVRPQEAQALARGLRSERAVIVYPDSLIISLPDALGISRQFVVDGVFAAAAFAGLSVSPQFDIAEPMTRKSIAGFDRLNRSLDEIEKNSLAIDGVTVLEDNGGSVRVRHSRTTDPSSVFTSEPSVVAIKDFVQIRTRRVLDRYIGQKFLISRAADVETTLSGLLNSLVDSEIIRGFGGVSAVPSPIDPTALEVVAFYSPVFPLNFIRLTFTLRSST
jgi:hypothetical protein